MYLYFLPFSSSSTSTTTGLPEEAEAIMPIPTSDGGVEHTEARFLWPDQWLSLAQESKIILYPPQHYLLHIIAQFFTSKTPTGDGRLGELREQRKRCIEFLKTGQPVWADKVISPDGILFAGGKVVLGLTKPGLELEGSGRSGDPDRVILVRNTKEGPREVEIRSKDSVLTEHRLTEQKGEKAKI